MLNTRVYPSCVPKIDRAETLNVSELENLKKPSEQNLVAIQPASLREVINWGQLAKND